MEGGRKGSGRGRECVLNPHQKNSIDRTFIIFQSTEQWIYTPDKPKEEEGPTIESQLLAHHSSIRGTKVAANSAPVSVDVHLHPA